MLKNAELQRAMHKIRRNNKIRLLSIIIIRKRIKNITR
jgi:hypothetical protein